MIDSGASHILVRQEHSNILRNITMFEPNAEPVMHLQTAKKGSTLHAIGQGLLYIGNFHLRAYIFKNDELDTSLLGLNPLTAQGCSATFTHESFSLRTTYRHTLSLHHFTWQKSTASWILWHEAQFQLLSNTMSNNSISEVKGYIIWQEPYILHLIRIYKW